MSYIQKNKQPINFQFSVQNQRNGAIQCIHKHGSHCKWQKDWNNFYFNNDKLILMWNIRDSKYFRGEMNRRKCMHSNNNDCFSIVNLFFSLFFLTIIMLIVVCWLIPWTTKQCMTTDDRFHQILFGIIENGKWMVAGHRSLAINNNVANLIRMKCEVKLFEMGKPGKHGPKSNCYRLQTILVVV